MIKFFKSATTHLAIAAALPLFLLASPASAQSGDQLKNMLDRADSNGDGSVTWSEFAQVRVSMFERMDRNSDGFVDRKDRPRMFGGRFDQAYGALSKLDTNGDKRISRRELDKGDAPGFVAADTNQDRVLSADEIDRIRSGF